MNYFLNPKNPKNHIPNPIVSTAQLRHEIHPPQCISLNTVASQSNFKEVATTIHSWQQARRNEMKHKKRKFNPRGKMHLPSDLIRVVTSFAWNVSFTDCELHTQLECCIDCQLHVPPWFLEDVIYCFPKRATASLWTLKFYNPLVFGAPFRPFDIRLERLNRRSCEWLFQSINLEYLRRKRIHRKPLSRILSVPLNEAWPRLLERIGDLERSDINPIGYMASLITQSMLLHLPLSGQLSNWTRLFDLFWPHGLPAS